MALVANSLIALIAVLHVYILVLEMFLWDKPTGLYGAATASRKILFIQALPAALGLVLLFLSCAP